MHIFLSIRNPHNIGYSCKCVDVPTDKQPPLHGCSSHPELVRSPEGRCSPKHTQTQPCPWLKELELPTPCVRADHLPAAFPLTTSPQPRPIYSHVRCLDMHLESGAVTLYQPLPTGSTGKRQQNITASGCISVDFIFFFGLHLGLSPTQA